MRSRRGLVGVFTGLTLIVAVALVGNAFSARANASSRSTLAGSAPSWANAKNYKSAADATADIGFRVYLGWNNPSAVEALA